jgi:Dolichyl-phosphate-mannose-protein mannosyltransferase
MTFVRAKGQGRHDRLLGRGNTHAATKKIALCTTTSGWIVRLSILPHTVILPHPAMSLATASAESFTTDVENSVRHKRRAKRSTVATWRLFVVVNIVAILGVALLMRVWQLGNIPGINGDEAEYGVRAVRFLRGEPIVWQTPTGNAVNPFFFFSQVAIHAVFSPSFTVLRLIAVASGLAALALNYLFSRRLFGRSSATVSTLILAVLPIDIAYGRFAWDTCQTLAASTLVVYPALLMLAERERRWRWFALACGGYAAAYLVHPTNVFLGAFLFAVPVVERRGQWQPWLRSRGPWIWAASAASVVALAALASWFARTVLSIGVMAAVTPSGLAEFVRNHARLFNGTTVYRYIAGSHAVETVMEDGWPIDFGWLDAATLAVFAGAAFVLCREIRRANSITDGGLIVGWLCTTCGFLLVAGPEAIRPHWERYGLCLILPEALIVARATTILIVRPSAFGRTATLVALATAWLLLFDFGVSYFGFIHRTGGESQETFRTAAIEPKQAALDEMLAERTPEQAVRIVAGEWWNYWPLAYLASAQPDVSVCWNETDATGAVSPRRESGAAHASGGTLASKPFTGQAAVWFVDYAGSEAHARHRRELVDELGAWRERFILDYAGRPTLVLFEPRASARASTSVRPAPYSSLRGG